MFRHEALLYEGETDLVARLVPYLREGVQRDEPVLVVVSAAKIALLRDALGADERGVTFADMNEVGHNPARIIPAWRRFVQSRPPGRALRGVGEPIWAERTPAQLVECQRHEALLNLAFAESSAWSLVCPYDMSSLSRDIVDEALRTHPYVHGEGISVSYRNDAAGLPEHPLPPPPAERYELEYGPGPLDEVHEFVRSHGRAAGLIPPRVTDLDIAVHELATNTVRHADGARGLVLLWVEGGDVVCEVRDLGTIGDPLAGRAEPDAEQETGRGLWIVNQLCDLVQVRSSRAGTVVRVRMAIDA